MPRKPTPWRIDLREPTKCPTVFAVLPWRGDGRYKIEQAMKVYQSRKRAEDFASKDTTGTLCVRELDAPVHISMASLILKAFKEARASDAPNIERQQNRAPKKLTGLRIVSSPDDPGEVWVTNDQGESYQVIADSAYGYRFIQQL